MKTTFPTLLLLLACAFTWLGPASLYHHTHEHLSPANPAPSLHQTASEHHTPQHSHHHCPTCRWFALNFFIPSPPPPTLRLHETPFHPLLIPSAHRPIFPYPACPTTRPPPHFLHG